MSEYLFVYGTLRRGSGHEMAAWLAQRAEWRGAASIAGRLYRVSYYPGLVRGEGQARGEVFELVQGAAEVLEALDAFEEIRGLPDDEYGRERCPVELADGSVVEAWVYWYRRDTAGLSCLPGGDWLKP